MKIAGPSNSINWKHFVKEGRCHFQLVKNECDIWKFWNYLQSLWATFDQPLWWPHDQNHCCGYSYCDSSWRRISLVWHCSLRKVWWWSLQKINFKPIDFVHRPFHHRLYHHYQSFHSVGENRLWMFAKSLSWNIDLLSILQHVLLSMSFW